MFASVWLKLGIFRKMTQARHSPLLSLRGTCCSQSRLSQRLAQMMLALSHASASLQNEQQRKGQLESPLMAELEVLGRKEEEETAYWWLALPCRSYPRRRRKAGNFLQASSQASLLLLHRCHVIARPLLSYSASSWSCEASAIGLDAVVSLPPPCKGDGTGRGGQRRASSRSLAIECSWRYGLSFSDLLSDLSVTLLKRVSKS